MITWRNEKEVGNDPNIVSRKTQQCIVKGWYSEWRTLKDRWRYLTIPDGEMRREWRSFTCHTCIKDSRRYGNISKQRVFKNGIQRKEEVAIVDLSAISLPEIPTYPQGTIKIQRYLDCSRIDRNNLICKMRREGLNLKGLKYRDEIEESESDTIKIVLILSSGIRLNAEITT